MCLLNLFPSGMLIWDTQFLGRNTCASSALDTMTNEGGGGALFRLISVLTTYSALFLSVILPHFSPIITNIKEKDKQSEIMKFPWKHVEATITKIGSDRWESK